MNFIAIDFETANEKRNSPCSMGLVVVKDGQIVQKIHYLIKPKEMRFMPINIGIHGIRPSMVEDELEFDEIWKKIEKFFNGTLIVAHNASFDISVLRSTLQLYKIQMPTFRYICTMKLSKNFYSNLDNSKLNTVSDFLGFEFNHHDALADALACSNILFNISKELNSTNIDEISDLTSVTLGSVNKEGYKPSSSKGRILKTSSRKKTQQTKSLSGIFDFSLFKDEIVVFTGKLNYMTREEAFKIVKQFGGIPGSSVTRKTTCLVTNIKNIEDLKIEEMSTKIKKALHLRSLGQKIKFLSEDDLLKK